MGFILQERSGQAERVALQTDAGPKGQAFSIDNSLPIGKNWGLGCISYAICGPRRTGGGGDAAGVQRPRLAAAAKNATEG